MKIFIGRLFFAALFILVAKAPLFSQIYTGTLYRSRVADSTAVAVPSGYGGWYYNSQAGEIRMKDAAGWFNPRGISSVAWGSITGTLSAQTDLQNALNGKQATLVSGTNIKTVGGVSLLGSGDIPLPFWALTGTSTLTGNTIISGTSQDLTFNTKGFTVNGGIDGTFLNVGTGGGFIQGTTGGLFLQMNSGGSGGSINIGRSIWNNGGINITDRNTISVTALNSSGSSRFNLLLDGLTTDVATFSDNTASPKGLQYNADYAATFVARSLVDKGYVDGAISSGTSGTALTKVDDTNVTLTLGGSPTNALLHATSLTLGWAGTLAISRGGTGSATQNFVDLSTNQTGIAGNKTWTGLHTFSSSPSAPQNTTSERFGLNNTAGSNTKNVLIGQNITGVQEGTIAIGYNAAPILNDYTYGCPGCFGGPPLIIGFNASGQGITLGNDAVSMSREGISIGQKSKALGLATVSIGDGSRAPGNNQIVMGDASYAGGVGSSGLTGGNIQYLFGGGHGLEHDYTMSIGGQGSNSSYNLSASTATHQAFLGWYDTSSSLFTGGGGLYNDWYIGGPVTASAPHDINFYNTNKSGVNVDGIFTTYIASRGTGTGNPGAFVWKTGTKGSSGSTTHALINKFSIEETSVTVYAGNDNTAPRFHTSLYGASGTETSGILGLNARLTVAGSLQQPVAAASLLFGFTTFSENRLYFSAITSGGSITHIHALDGTTGHSTLMSGGQYAWVSSATNARNTPDTGLKRLGAASIQVTDGSSGSGSLTASSLAATTSVSAGGNAAAAGYIDLKEDTDNGTNRVRIQGPASTADQDYVWPTVVPASNGYVLSSTTGGTMSWVAQSSGIGGSTGSTDNAVLRADGTGGSTAQASAVIIDDNGNPTFGVSSSSGDKTVNFTGSLTDVDVTFGTKGGGDFVFDLNRGGTDPRFITQFETVNTSTTHTASQIELISTGTAANGFGYVETLNLENGSSTSARATEIAHTWIDATNSSEDAKIDFKTITAGSVGTDMTVSGAGVSIRGTVTNDAASAGFVGEEISAIVSTYTNYTTTATYQNITSITLTPGDWDLSAFGTFYQNSATVTLASNAIFAVSTTTASASGATEGLNTAYVAPISSTSTTKFSTAIAPYRVSISGSTTYYLNTQATFTSGNPQFVGSIRARRIR